VSKLELYYLLSSNPFRPLDTLPFGNHTQHYPRHRRLRQRPAFAVVRPAVLAFVLHRMAQYTPSAIRSRSGALADDGDFETTYPRICVDYLSHQWQEEDVWRSWRSMTRFKYQIANGMRLENASWRTWWKQRNKLRTVSPETLNW